MAIYSDDLESYGTGAGIPTGYTGRWNYASGEWDRVTDTDVAVRHVETNIARTAVSMNAVDSDGNRANFDILVRFKATSGLGSDLRGGVVGRGSGSAGAESGYTCAINLTELRIGKYSGGASSQVGTTTGLGLSSSATYYWVRFRGQGTSSPVTLKAKIWTGLESDEPGTWTLEVSDSTSPLTANGWCGMFSFSDGTKHWRDIAVATNGDVASFSASGAVLEAAATGSGTATAALTTGAGLAASAEASGVASAALTTSIRLTAAAQVGGVATADLSVGGAAALSAAATASGVATAALLTSIRLAAAAQAAGAATASLTTGGAGALAAAAIASAQASAALTTAIRLAAAAQATGVAAASLTVGAEAAPEIPLSRQHIVAAQNRARLVPYQDRSRTVPA